MNLVLFPIFVSVVFTTLPALSQETINAGTLFNQGNEEFSDGKYKDAITIYDEILEVYPENIPTLKMKGLALSILGQQENSISYHQSSLKQFYKAFQQDPGDVFVLTGLGVGFGFLGEYHEASNYFKKADSLNPNKVVLQNYDEFVDKVIAKYPYTPTEKPKSSLPSEPTKIP